MHARVSASADRALWPFLWPPSREISRKRYKHEGLPVSCKPQVFSNLENSVDNGRNRLFTLHTQEVTGSSPVAPTIKINKLRTNLLTSYALRRRPKNGGQSNLWVTPRADEHQFPPKKSALTDQGDAVPRSSHHVVGNSRLSGDESRFRSRNSPALSQGSGSHPVSPDDD